MNAAPWKRTNQQSWRSARQRCRALRNLRVLQPSLLFSVTLLCRRFSTQPYWLREEQPFQEPRRPAAPAGGEIYCDNIWTPPLSSELGRAATKRKRCELLPPLHLSPEFLRLPPSVIALHSPSRVLSIHPAHSLVWLSVPSCFRCHPSLFKSNHALSSLIKTDARLA